MFWNGREHNIIYSWGGGDKERNCGQCYCGKLWILQGCEKWFASISSITFAQSMEYNKKNIWEIEYNGSRISLTVPKRIKLYQFDGKS